LSGLLCRPLHALFPYTTLFRSRKGARVRQDLTGDDAKERRLTGAVGTDHSDDPAPRKRERQILKEDLVAEPFRQAVGFQHDVSQARKSTRLNSTHVSISYAVFC